MAHKKIEGFDVLTDLAGKFVESRKGIWDHIAWLTFLLDIQKKGFALSDNMKTYLGLVLNAMKKLYDATTATKGMENVMSDISEYSVNFIKRTKGIWNHSEWEIFLKDFQKKGIDLTEETSSYLGQFLETVREIYIILPPVMGNVERKKSPKKK